MSGSGETGGHASIAARLARTAAKLDALREASLVEAPGPPLSEERVTAFEDGNAVRLPADYRAFLTTIGNGGPGPYRGLEALDPALRDRQLAGAFPYGPDDLTGAWTAEMTEWAYWDAHRGTVPLARHHDVEWSYHETAEPMSLLVVTGPGRGRVVMVDRRREHFPPVFHPARDFLDWYERWLDDRAAGRSGFRSDFGRPDWSAAAVRDHPDPGEAIWSARMLAARIGRGDWEQATPAMSATLAEAAAGAPDPRVRAAAVWALYRVRRDAGALALPLLADPDPRVRREAVVAVRRSAGLGEEAVRAAFRPLLSDPDPELRAAVTRPLLGVDGRAEAVLRALLTDPDPRARVAGLGQIAMLGPWAADRDPRLIDAARPLLRDPEPDVRARAVTALDLAGAPFARAMLAAAALTDPATAVRREAARRLLRHGDRAALIPLVPALLTDPDHLIRHRTLLRLGRGSDRVDRIPPRYWASAVPPLVRDPDPLIAMEAVTALVHAGQPPPEEAWTPLLTSEDHAVRRRALWLTDKIARPPGGPVHAILHRLLRDPSQDARWSAARRLKEACAAACRPDLAAVLAAEDDRMVRHNLELTLARLDGG